MVKLHLAASFCLLRRCKAFDELKHLMGFGVKNTVPILKPKILIDPLTLLTEYFFGKITDLYVNYKTIFMQGKLIQQQNAVINQGPV